MMARVEEVEVVVAHNERATVRVGDVFLKIDADQTRTDVEVEAMAMAPVPTPEMLRRKPPAAADDHHRLRNSDTTFGQVTMAYLASSRGTVRAAGPSKRHEHH